jgi:hypothetical protein
LGSLWAIIILSISRGIVQLIKFGNVSSGQQKNRRFVIVGDLDEAKRVRELLQHSYSNPGFIGLISPKKKEMKNNGFIGSLPQIKEIIRIYRIDEVIFCSKSITHQAIIDQMSALQDLNVDYKIAPEDSLSIIGSNSINTAGDLYTVNINAITNTENRRNKRLLDLSTCLAGIILLPVLLFLVEKPAGYVRNLFLVLLAFRTWVSFSTEEDNEAEHLPSIRKGILNPIDAFGNEIISDEMKQRLNYIYTRDYHIKTDLNIILKGYRQLGRKS